MVKLKDRGGGLFNAVFLDQVYSTAKEWLRSDERLRSPIDN